MKSQGHHTLALIKGGEEDCLLYCSQYKRFCVYQLYAKTTQKLRQPYACDVFHNLHYSSTKWEWGGGSTAVDFSTFSRYV